MHIIVLFLLFSSVLSSENTKWCRATTRIYPETLWSIATGGDCFAYAKPSWKKQNLKLYGCTIRENNVAYRVQCAVYKNITNFYFDYTNTTSTYIIENELMKDGYYAKWLNCAEAADECCTKHMTNENIYPTAKFSCPYIWDIWSCYPAAEKDTISKQQCPDYTSSSNVTPCILYSEKECFSHGEWNQTTNYAVCATAPVYRRRHNFNIIVCYVAIALCFPAVVIFISFKKLRTTRINLHRNLLIACILKNILTAVSKELVILDSLKPSKDSNKVLEENGIPCRVLAFFASASVNAVYACMLMDGFYLHKLIARVFNKIEPGQILIYSVTLGITFIPTIIWAIVVALNDNTNCWMVDNSGHEWILDGFRIAILAINIILLLDIARVLCMKLKKDMSKEHTKYTYILINGKSYNSILKRAFKSTFRVMIFLAILFGVPFIFTANRDIIDRDSCIAGDIFYYSSYLIHALQGVMVAFLFCYFNKEVHNQIKEAFRKTKISTRSRLSTVNFRRVTNRQDTSGTFISNNYSKTTEAKKLSIKQDRRNQEAAKKLSDLIEASATNPNQETQSDAKNEDNLSNKISKFIDDSVSDPQTYENNKVK